MKTKLTLLMLALVALAASAATQVARRAAADPINAAIEAAKDGVVAVYLDEDLTLTKPITVPLGKQLVIYGRNHTLTLGSGAKFVISDNLTLNNVKIDASNSGAEFIKVENVTGEKAKKADGTPSAYSILDNITLKGLTITGLSKQLINNASGNVLFKNILVAKSVIEVKGSNAIFALGNGYPEDLTITKSTLWSKAGHTGFLFQAHGKAPDINAAYKTSWTIDKSTLYQIAVGKKANNTNTFKGKNYLVMTLTNSILYNFGSSSGNEINGWLFGQNSTNPVRTYSKNTYWAGNAVATGWTDSSKQGSDQTGTALTTNPGFKDPANGDFTVEEGSQQAIQQTGDPRWLPRDEYLYTLDFASLTDEDYEAIPTSIDGIAINDEVSDAVVTITGSDNKYVKGEAVALEMNGGALEFTAPEGSMIQNIFIDFEEWNEGNTAEGVEPTISVDAEKKQAVISDASPVVKLNIAGKTVIKNIFVELSTRSDKIVIDAPAGASLNKLVEDTYAENPYVGQITMNLEKDGKYTVNGPLFVNCPLYINGAEGVEIDAAASKDPFILMRPLPELGLNANGAYEIKGIAIKDVKITGLKNRLFYANRQDYLIGKLAVENSVLQFDGSTPRSIFDFYCGGNYEELSIVNSTLYADPSNAMRGGLISTQSSKSIIELGGESQKLSIKNSTLYNIAYGKTPVLLQRHSQYYLSFELMDNVIVNCGEKGNFVAGLNEGQKSSEVEWVVDSNAFNFDGEDSGANEAYGNALSGVVKFADAAKGDFTQSNVAAGDPRWISGTPTAIETVKTAEETSLENAVIYNLNGQRVDKAQKGLYIVNGKKVVIK